MKNVWVYLVCLVIAYFCLRLILWLVAQQKKKQAKLAEAMAAVDFEGELKSMKAEMSKWDADPALIIEPLGPKLLAIMSSTGRSPIVMGTRLCSEKGYGICLGPRGSTLFLNLKGEFVSVGMEGVLPLDHAAFPFPESQIIVRVQEMLASYFGEARVYLWDAGRRAQIWNAAQNELSPPHY